MKPTAIRVATITIPEPLYRRAKQRARLDERTFSYLVRAGLQLLLAKDRKP